MTQLLIAIFGLSSIYMAMDNDTRLRKWAPIVGLCGQPAWLYFAWQSQAWGLGLLVAAYTVVYANGVRVQWRKP